MDLAQLMDRIEYRYGEQRVSNQVGPVDQPAEPDVRDLPAEPMRNERA
jgi:hypothetical protein